MLFVGLGNPGEQYAKTRHNIGFMVVDHIAASLSGTWSKGYKGEYSEVFVGGRKHYLLKPQTFMNLSGESVQPFCAFYKIPSTEIAVIHDDLDMEFGKLKMRRNGSSGGHNGIKSIIQMLGTEDFMRVKLGIGHDRRKETVGHVLGRFQGEEADKLDEFIQLGAKAALCIAEDGIGKAMNTYNNRCV